VEINGRIIIEDRDDLKATQLTVTIIPRTPSGTMSEDTAEVKNDLSFKLANAGLESYDVEVTPMPETFYLKSIHLGQRDVTEAGLDFTQGIPSGDLTIVLNPNGGQIDGSVRDAKDEPAIGATVTLIPDPAHQSLAWMYKTTQTDQSGHFAIKGVRPGEYRIYGWEEIEHGAYEDPEFLKPHESESEKVSIKESGHGSVNLKLISAENDRGTAVQK
jgi:hypothetical protein